MNRFVARMPRLEGLRAHGDLLLLQAGNWLSGQILFAVFGAFAPRATLAHAAFLETASAFFGTTCASVAWRLGFDSALAMRGLVATRFALLLGMSCAAFLNCMPWTWVVGFAPSLLTPAHFPVVFGARRRSVGVLVGIRLMACATCALLNLTPAQAFMVYFVPGIAYALLLHAVHFDDWARAHGSSRAARATHRTSQPQSSLADALFLLPVASAGLFFMQASIVYGIATISPVLASAERFMRSGYSLAYPYFMRSERFDSQLRRSVAVFAFTAPLAAAASRMLAAVVPLALWIWVPTLIDFVTTNLFRLSHGRLLALAGWVTLLAALIAWNVHSR